MNITSIHTNFLTKESPFIQTQNKHSLFFLYLLLLLYIFRSVWFLLVSQHFYHYNYNNAAGKKTIFVLLL